MSISRKAFLIISLPILFQIGFVLTVAVIEHRAENYQLWQAHSTDTALLTYRLLGLVLDAESATKAYVRTGDMATLVPYRTALERIPDELKRLRILSQLEVAERVDIDLPDRYRVSGLERTLQPLLATLTEQNGLAHAGRRAEAVAELQSEANLLNAFRRQVDGFLDEEEAVEQEQQSDWRESQRSLRNAVVVIAVSNVLLTIGLLSFVLRSMRERLALVLQNTERLARGEPLHEVTPGRDEIAQLDASFHAMADRLRQTQDALHHEMFELARAKSELTSRKAALEELNAEKSRFIGMAAHDLRNPLFAVLTFSETLTRIDSMSASQLALVQRIQSTVRSMSRLVDGFLDASMIESGTLQLHLADGDLALVARQCIELLRPAAEQKQIELRLEGDPEARALFDADKIAQVIANLVSNGMKFSPPASTVLIRIAHSDNQLELSVRDEGKGIDPAELHLLFRPFSLTKNDATGGESRTGLGLAICRRIIEEHGGQISVQSTPGVGSTFRFVVPLEPQEALQPS